MIPILGPHALILVVFVENNIYTPSIPALLTNLFAALPLIRITLIILPDGLTAPKDLATQAPNVLPPRLRAQFPYVPGLRRPFGLAYRLE